MTEALLHFDRAREELAHATAIDEVKVVRDKAEALRLYSRQAGHGLEMQNQCAEIKLRAERRAGELLREMEKSKGGQPYQSRSSTGRATDEAARGGTAPPTAPAAEYRQAPSRLNRLLHPAPSAPPPAPPAPRSVAKPPTLDQLGISRDQSSAWQKIAAVPEEEFEAHVAETKATGQELTTAGVLRAVKDKERKAAQQERETAKAAQVRAEPERPVIRRESALTVMGQMPKASVDLLLTDPPYMTDVDDIAHFVRSWVPLACRLVKPTGRAYICTGSYPEELVAYLDVLEVAAGLGDADLGHLALDDVLVWTYRNTLGPSPKLGYKRNWQAVFYLVGRKAPPLACPEMLEQFSVQDIAAPDGRQGNRYHPWQKPDELAERFIRHATKPGDLVFDPFAGTGTFVLAAARLGRRGIGVEVDGAALAVAERRGCRCETR